MLVGLRALLTSYQEDVLAVILCEGPEPTPEPTPEPAPETKFPEGHLDTDLDGKRLPVSIGHANYPSNPHQYGRTVRDGSARSQVLHSARHGVLASNAELSDLVVHTCGGDGVKWEYGSLDMRRLHISHLGLEDKAHADGMQARGNGSNAYISDTFFDMPVDVGDGTKSNACVLLQSATGDMGVAEFERCIFYGGNYTLWTSAKKTDNKVCKVVVRDSAFIVDVGKTPRYGLFALEGEAEFHNCRVYELQSDGTLKLAHTGDPREYQLPK